MERSRYVARITVISLPTSFYLPLSSTKRWPWGETKHLCLKSSKVGHIKPTKIKNGPHLLHCTATDLASVKSQPIKIATDAWINLPVKCRRCQVLCTRGPLAIPQPSAGSWQRQGRMFVMSLFIILWMAQLDFLVCRRRAKDGVWINIARGRRCNWSGWVHSLALSSHYHASWCGQRHPCFFFFILQRTV